MRYNIWYYASAILLTLVLCACATSIKPPRNAKTVVRTIETTGYCACGKCCNWQRTFYGKPVIADGPNKGKRKKVGITASGTKSKPGTLAADTSIYPFGTVMYIPGYGYGRVEDRGSAIKGGRLDLFFNSHKEALKWGRQQKRIKIWLRP